MPYIYTLDLSFCTRITVSSLVNLLEIRKESLTELRLQNCGQLDISVDPEELDPNPNGGSAGRSILNTIRSDGDRCALNILDVRCCGGQPKMMEPFPSNDPFVEGMRSIQFEQVIPGFFSRPARWNQNVQERLVDQVMSLKTSSSNPGGSGREDSMS
jgi:hypothetical protein